MKRALVTGAAGMLGRDLMQVLEEAPFEAVGVDKAEGDIGNAAEVAGIVAKAAPDVIFHLAAMTQVDRCEEDLDEAYRINALGARNVALAAAASGAKVLLVSTDYVFDGTADRPYEPWDEPNPASVYGRSKLAGERLAVQVHRQVLVVRTSWLFGLRGRNFVEAILGQVESGKPRLAVVADQRGCPTYTVDLAGMLVSLAERCPPGILHVTNGGDCTWRDFAEEIVVCAGHEQVPIDGITTAQAGRPAPRPAYSVLGSRALRLEGFEPLRPWQDALRDYLRARTLHGASA